MKTGINPVLKQTRSNCWPATEEWGINPFIFFPPHVNGETTYKLRLYLSCNGSQVWPARISGVMESVFRCSGPNSKSIVTLTRPAHRKNGTLHLRSAFPGHCCHRRLSYWLLWNKKISSRSTIIKTNAVPLDAEHTKSWRLLSVSLQKIQSRAAPTLVLFRSLHAVKGL